MEFFAAVYRRPDPILANTIRLLDLAPVLRKRVDALSKGFCRRLMLALALLTPHPLLLMDEPFDGFDLRQTREMRSLGHISSSRQIGPRVGSITQISIKERIGSTSHIPAMMQST